MTSQLANLPDMINQVLEQPRNTLPRVLQGINVHFVDVEEVAKYKRIVLALGGKVLDTLSQQVTFAVISRVGTANYSRTIAKSKEFKTDVIHVSWLDQCYKLKEYVEPSQFHAKPFTGLGIACTGILDREDRNKVVDLITVNGGRYHNSLDKNLTSHLVCPPNYTAEPNQSDKYKHAIAWGNIKVVDTIWLLECVSQKSKMCLSLFYRFCSLILLTF
jgi:hypothetical protein